MIVKAASSAPPAKVNVCVSFTSSSTAESVPMVVPGALFSAMLVAVSAMSVGLPGMKLASSISSMHVPSVSVMMRRPVAFTTGKEKAWRCAGFPTTSPPVR